MRRGFPSGTLTPGGSQAATGARSPSHSPWHSPKPTSLSLNPNSAAFKFSVGANEFRPGGSSMPGSGRASPSMPGTPSGTRSPMPMTAEQAQQHWAQHHSPLSTPKRNQPPGFETSSASSSPSFFPRQLDHALAQKQKIPRMPWADISDSSGAEDEGEPGYARIDDSALPAETVAAFGGGTNSPFYSPAIPIDQAYAQQQAYSGEGEEPQWADPNAPPPDASYFAYRGQVYPPQGYPPPPPGAYAGGPMYDPALYPQSGELTPGGSYAPSRGGGPGPAFITLPGPAPGEMPSIDFANQLSGSAGGGGIGAYALTPFDHLHSIFGADVSEQVLEEALNQTGFDVDKAIEYIIDTQMGTLPPQPPPGMGPPPPGMAGAPPGMEFLPPPPSRGFGASGSRPLVISRDSFDGFGGGNGGRGGGASPRFGGSRSGTPTGEAGGRGVGGRVCRFYLAGNCLRSDCRFSHDVSKAVCKCVGLSSSLLPH